MEADDFRGTVELDSEEAVARLIAEQRFDGANYVLLVAPSGFPRLHVLLFEDRANLLFQRELEDPGSISVSSDAREGQTTFYQCLHEGMKADPVVLDDVNVVSSDVAVLAAREFYSDPYALPRSVTWYEL